MTANPYASWMNRPKTEKPSLFEMYRSCVANAEGAAKEASNARAVYQRLPVGDVRLPQVRADIRRYATEQAHWREYAAFYKAKLPVQPVADAQDRRLPREPGDDDEELPL